MIPRMELHWNQFAIKFEWAPAGLGFSRPKPVFPVQNGINWDKPVFPVQNWEKLSKTGKNYMGLYFKLQKVSKNVYQIKI